jgi:CBS domain-containing protein
MKVKDVMATDVVSCHRNSQMPEVIRLLAQHGLHGVPVVDDQENLVGVLSELDIIHRAFPDYVYSDSALLKGLTRADVLKLRNLDTLTVSSFMTKSVHTVSPEDDLIDAARTMVEQRLNRLPVVEDKKVVGLLSRHDVLAALLKMMPAPAQP